LISGIRQVSIMVDDQDRARRFWSEAVGFEVTTDTAYRDERWLEVTPPDGGPRLVLELRPAGTPKPDVPDGMPHSPVFFTCEDIETTYEEMTERGVRFTTPPKKMEFGWWAVFEDEDETRYALGQRDDG
jgi:lactoylglutathione lyase